MKYLISLFLLLFVTDAALAQSRSLDEYVQQAIKNSPLIKDLNNQVLSAKIDSVRIRAGFKPQVSAGSAGLYAPVVKGYGYAAAITNEHTINGLLSVTKSFIGKNYLNSQFAGIGFQQDSLRNSVKLSEQDLRKSIGSQYIAAYGSLQQQKFNQEVVDLLSKEEDLLKKLTRNNVYTQTEYLTFLVTLKQAQLQLLQSRLQYKTDLATLNYLSGIADTAIVDLPKPDLQKALGFDRRNSIFFKQFQIDSMRLANSRKLIDYSYKPKLSAYVDGGYNSDLMSQAYKNFGASVGFTLTVPIYDGGQRKLQYSKLSLEQETQRGYRDFFSNQYAQQISQLNRQIADYDTLIKEIEEQFKYSESLIKVDTKLLQTGDLKIADLILAVNNYLTIKNLLTQNTISRLQLINELNYWSR